MNFKTYVAFVGSLALAGVLLPAPMSVVASEATDLRSSLAAESPAPAFNVCVDSDVSRLLGTAKPGDLLAAPQDVTIESQLIEGRLFRVLYATSAPAGKVQAACSITALPRGDSINSVLVEGHGAWGLLQRCQPSMALTNFVSSPSSGSQWAGPLFSTVKSGGAFIAPDYPAAGAGGSRLQPIGHGVAQGLSVLDAARAVTNNPAAFNLAPIAPDAEIPLVLTGYSQGGGAVLWAGQLAKYYFDFLGDRRLNLAGVMAFEPGGVQLVANPRESRALVGRHLLDLVVYKNLGFFVYLAWITSAWSQMADADKGPIPFGPTARTVMSGALSSEGLASAAELVKYCSSEQLQLGLAIAKYRDPAKHRLLRAPFAGVERNAEWTAAADKTCLRAKGVAREVVNWCRWLQFNTAGPNGVNPFPKYATDNNGDLVPLYLLHGRDDHTIWCVDGEGDVDARNCVTRQFYDSLESAYCEGKGYLKADYFAGVGHGDLYWRSMQSPVANSYYFGSRFETFVSGAIAGTLPSTCQQTNVPAP